MMQHPGRETLIFPIPPIFPIFPIFPSAPLVMTPCITKGRSGVSAGRRFALPPHPRVCAERRLVLWSAVASEAQHRFSLGTVQPSWTFPASESAVAACTYPGPCLFMRPWPERCLIPAFSSR